MVRRNLYLSLVAICILVFSPVGTASFVEEGPYFEMDTLELEPSNSQDFFIMDELGAETASLPSLMPCEGKVTSGFGRRRRRRFHKGIDIAAPRGTPIFAAAHGKVIFSGRKGGYGKTVMLDHGAGVQTLYAHNSKIEVQEGDWVSQGQQISKVGNTGRSTGPHLHYEVRLDGRPVNPKPYLTNLIESL